MPVKGCTLPYLSVCTRVRFTLPQCLYKGALYLTSVPVQGCALPYLSACTRVRFTLPQCLYKGAIYLTLPSCSVGLQRVHLFITPASGLCTYLMKVFMRRGVIYWYLICLQFLIALPKHPSIFNSVLVDFSKMYSISFMTQVTCTKLDYISVYRVKYTNKIMSIQYTNECRRMSIYPKGKQKNPDIRDFTCRPCFGAANGFAFVLTGHYCWLYMFFNASRQDACFSLYLCWNVAQGQTTVRLN